MKTKNITKVLVAAFLILFSLKSFTQSKKEMVLSYEKHNNITEMKRRELINIFDSKDNPDYYVCPQIPRRKLKKASKRAYIPKSEVIVLIDLQLMGPAKNFLIIGTSGIYFKNGGAAMNPGRHFIPYDSFKTKEIGLKGDSVGVGELLIDVSGSWAELEFVINLLKDLQKEI